ncbi:MAG TPA: hypothetical protein VGF94_12245 [Kofleriaceae bacterium]
MAKPHSTPLVAAATEFDDALVTYARLGELFLKTPLDSIKHLERANATLGELAACEGRLQLAGKQLVEALSAARSQQEELGTQVVAHAPAVQARNTKLQELMTAMTGLATEVAAVNGKVSGGSNDPGEIASAVGTLSERAAELASSARDSLLGELAEQAHALRQRLEAIAAKLRKAAGN